MTAHTTPGQEEKRQYYRLASPYKVEARELVLPLPKEPLFTATCYDISRGGLCIPATVALDVGTRLMVNVHIPLLNKFSRTFFKVYENDAEQYFQAIAEVAWLRPYQGAWQMGVNFINADDDLLYALGKLVDEAAALEAASK